MKYRYVAENHVKNLDMNLEDINMGRRSHLRYEERNQLRKKKEKNKLYNKYHIKSD